MIRISLLPGFSAVKTQKIMREIVLETKSTRQDHKQ